MNVYYRKIGVGKSHSRDEKASRYAGLVSVSLGSLDKDNFLKNPVILLADIPCSLFADLITHF